MAPVPVLFVAIFAIAIFVFVLVFGIWLMVSLLRGILRLIFGPPAQPPRNKVAVQQRSVLLCNRPACRTDNPAYARFCRKCGQPLTAAQVRRVA